MIHLIKAAITEQSTYQQCLLCLKVNLLALVAWFSVAHAAPHSYPKARVSFTDFKGLVEKVEAHRAQRLISLDTFMAMSKEPGTIVLDSRSAFRFDRIHLKGAKHLAFTDFTQANLRAVIPKPDTRILIYCNNNFDGNQVDFPSKVSSFEDVQLNKQISSQRKPLMMALNVPTYINLYGYGYQNVYELDELVNVQDTRIIFEGSIVQAKVGQ